jgi:hypothetical protein
MGVSGHVYGPDGMLYIDDTPNLVTGHRTIISSSIEKSGSVTRPSCRAWKNCYTIGHRPKAGLNDLAVPPHRPFHR